MKDKMKKTKIICTIGPASEDPKMLKKLVLAGMNVMRCNFSHGDMKNMVKKCKQCVMSMLNLGQTVLFY